MDENENKVCPYCAETIKRDAKICRFCQLDLSTGKPISNTQSQVVNPNTVNPKTVRAKSGVADGVKMGCGMFIILPLIIIFVFLFILAILGSL